MTIHVSRTILADLQIKRLRNKDFQSFGAFAIDLRNRGCAALGYRLSGPEPVDALCVKHLAGQLRAVVGFRRTSDALILLVGPHVRDDPGLDVYTLLYQLVGIAPPAEARRNKPPCCDSGTGLPSEFADQIDELVDRARVLTRGRIR